MRVLVTGGGGFLGGAVARMLLARGDDVVSVQRGPAPAIEALGARVVRGDIGAPGVIEAAAAGCEAIVHVAAKAGVWGPYAEYHEANVVGTERVIAAAQRLGIGRLVYTSTPSVVHGGHAVEGGDESLPYPERHEAPYPATKTLAEKAVLAANSEALSTVALRPHLIWGPGDNHLVPRILDRARKGRLALIGDGSNLIDTIYVDNAAAAHLLALDRLAPGAACAGKAYFLTNGDPRPMREILAGIVQAAGLPAPTRSVPPGLAWAVGGLLEGVYGLFGVKAEPPMTRFVASQLSTAHWFDISAIRRDLGYAPAISIDEGMARLAAALQG